MREECTHFQSRTYASGEAARFCRLDLAPEAPWRCPADCPSLPPAPGRCGLGASAALVQPALEDEPPGDGADIAALLESAEDAVNEVAPTVLADVLAEEAKRDRAAGRWWRKKR